MEHLEDEFRAKQQHAVTRSDTAVKNDDGTVKDEWVPSNDSFTRQTLDNDTYGLLNELRQRIGGVSKLRGVSCTFDG